MVKNARFGLRAVQCIIKELKVREDPFTKKRNAAG